MSTLSKTEIRNKLIKQRDAHSESDAKNFGEALLPYAHFLKKYSAVFLYSSIRSEISTGPLFKFLKGHVKIYYPRVVGEHLEFREINSEKDFIHGKFANEPGPGQIEWNNSVGPTVAIIPGVAFSFSLERLGYGKGFYDRFLERHPAIYKVGIAYADQIHAPWAKQAHDICMDAVLTPCGVWGRV